MDPIALLDESQQLLAGVVEQGVADTPGAATPCEGWDASTLLSHVLATVDSFSAPVDGGPGATMEQILAGEDWLGDDAIGATKRTLERSHAAWASVTDFTSEVTTNLGPMPTGQAIAIVTFQNVVHAWDLARATGQSIAPSAGLLGLCEGVAAAVLPAVPPGFFAPSVEAPSAGRTEQLMALCGRKVS
jgi:uncharacterized protein (TIGR03086 family)